MQDHEVHESVISRYEALSNEYDWVLILSRLNREASYNFSTLNGTLFVTCTPRSAACAVEDVLSNMPATDGIIVNDGFCDQDAIDIRESAAAVVGPSARVSLHDCLPARETLAREFRDVVFRAKAAGFTIKDLIDTAI